MAAFDTVRLETPRLLLRPLTPADAPALFAISGDPQVARYLSRPAWKDISLAHESIARDIKGMAAGEYLRLGIVRREDDTLIGDCCLFSFNTQCRRAELGYSQLRSAWGNGYVNEALRALVSLAFGELGLNRIEADIDPRNEASARSLLRLGFKHEGYLRERWIVDGEISDTGLYGLLRSDWLRGHGGASASSAAG